MVIGDYVYHIEEPNSGGIITKINSHFARVHNGITESLYQKNKLRIVQDEATTLGAELSQDYTLGNVSLSPYTHRIQKGSK